MNYYEYFRNKGFVYSNEVLTNFFLSLKTKPFVILTGISGSGKSKIAELFAEYVTDDIKEQLEFVSVKPNWKDSKDLFGYHNVLDNTYSVSPFLKLIIKAKLNPEKPFFLILDEMNLAKVEHYLADYLSCLESRRIEKIKITKRSKLNELLIDVFGEITAWQSAVLSALDLKFTEGKDTENTLYPIKLYRENRIANWWRTYFSESKHWTELFRTEFNNPSRRGSKFFTGGDGKYRLLKEDEITDPKVLADLQKLKLKYKNFITGYDETTHTEEIQVVDKITIKQQTIKLHNLQSHLLPSIEGFGLREYNPETIEDDLFDKTNHVYFIPSEIEIPLNVFVIGTVNIDETTYMFSPKVLDRANIIEFNEVNVANMLNDSSFPLGITAISDEDYTLKEPNNINMDCDNIPNLEHTRKFYSDFPDEFIVLNSILEKLKKHNMHFGYRVLNEISYYILNSQYYLNEKESNIKTALDIQILQKILPKLNGSIQKLWNPLSEILIELHKDNLEIEPDIDFESLLSKTLEKKSIHLISNEELIEKFDYPRSAKKILHLLNNLNSQGFVSFIE